MSAPTQQSHEHLSVVLVGVEVLMAQTAVRRTLTKIRNNYRNDIRRPGKGHFAATEARRFDDYLDLFERLGGDPGEVRDIEDGAS